MKSKGQALTPLLSGEPSNELRLSSAMDLAANMNPLGLSQDA